MQWQWAEARRVKMGTSVSGGGKCVSARDGWKDYLRSWERERKREASV